MKPFAIEKSNKTKEILGNETELENGKFLLEEVPGDG